MATYTQTKATLDSIARNAASLKSRNDNLLVSAQNIKNQLQTLASENSGFVSQLDIDAAGNTGDAAWEAAKAEKDLIVAEFIIEKARADTIVTALTGL